MVVLTRRPVMVQVYRSRKYLLFHATNITASRSTLTILHMILLCNRVIDGQTVEHKTNPRSSGLHYPHHQQSHAAGFHYNKGYGLDRPHSYGQDTAFPSSTIGGELHSMMWPPTPSIAGNGSGGLQVPTVSQHGQYASSLLTFEGSPILSSPPSSNASSSSAQTYATSYGLMVPPTVPSSSQAASSGALHPSSSAASTATFDMDHTASSPTKTEIHSGAERDVPTYGHGYSSSYAADGSGQFASWSESGPASAYVSSSPTPPPPAPTPHAPTFQFDAWQQQPSSSASN